MAQLENIEAIEKRLWKAADTLRSNSVEEGRHLDEVQESRVVAARPHPGRGKNTF